VLTETRADGAVRERELTDEDEARRLLEEEFGIVVPDGTALLG
jgi:N-hydroxyarylamine O-acetyltransferase